ncbi:PqqD family protein [Paenarthrobacter sp. NPDC018779]|uniref:PqqD family protein n=1 Tax=Paenarthrobacter sp. NPDC018779 TaxID=3364375 RepID=UPI0037CBDB70
MRKATKAIADSDVFETAPKLTFNLDDDGLTVFDARGGSYWRGNATAGEVMEGIRLGRPVNSLITSIAEAYKVDQERVRGDVHALLAELEQHGIIQRVRQ